MGLHLHSKNEIVETRKYESYGYRADFGRASIMIICPFCGDHCRGYVWSLAGGGKRCPGCRCLHGSGRSFKEINVLATATVGHAYECEIHFWAREAAAITGINPLPGWVND